MDPKISRLIEEAVKQILSDETDLPSVDLTAPARPEHGDYATNIALKLAKRAGRPPRDLATEIIGKIDAPELIESAEVAGPGFINLRLSGQYWYDRLLEIEKAGEDYGRSSLGGDEKIQVEFVSANPTGPLHFGHGRGAAIGDSLCRILSFSGFDVTREFYINDAGNQMNLLGSTLMFRYAEVCGGEFAEPTDENWYRGEYMIDIAIKLKEEAGSSWLELPADEAIEKATEYAGKKLLELIREDLAVFGVEFDNWFSETTLHASGEVGRALDELREKGRLYEKDGATWFASSEFGDEKDRVVIRSTEEGDAGALTYFAADIAYHRQKFTSGFNRVIDLWGADHHGYIPRVSAAMQALGIEPDKFEVIIIKLVNLLRDGKPYKLSKRAGAYDTLRDIIDEVGADAARFIFLSRKSSSQLDFDLSTAVEQSKNNPVYYVQYASARISGVFDKAATAGIELKPGAELDLKRLAAPEEIRLIRTLCTFPAAIAEAVAAREPQVLQAWTDALAKEFHYYYTMGNKNVAYRIVPPASAGVGSTSGSAAVDQATAEARLYLAARVRQTLKVALHLLGVGAPESM